LHHGETQNKKMGLLKEIAAPLISRGVPVIPLRPKTKVAFLSNWQDLATTDEKIIEEWDRQDENYNAACVAFAKIGGVWFLEIDQAGFAKKIEEQTGQKIPPTFAVRSSPGRGHFYFRQTPASIRLGNVQGKDASGKECWSARVDNRYVVAPGSYHPTSGGRYEILRDSEILEAPNWLVEWCAKSSKEEKIKVAADSDEIFFEGNRNVALTSILGKARQTLKMGYDELFAYGMAVNQRKCRPPLSEQEVRTIANSISKYVIKESGSLVFPPVSVSETEPLEIPRIPYPMFPRWAMEGTSIYEGFVKPICDANSRYPEFMFIPAMVIVLNYLALKVRVEDKQIIPSFYTINIGRKGRVIKSSSVLDAIDYLQSAGIVEHGGAATRNASGKSLIWTPGSPEGLGLEMSRTNNRNAVMFYDELSNLTNKASIESSTLVSSLLTMYESGKFSNTIKSRRESYSFEPRTYCASLIACTTDKNFHSLWSKMSAGSSGLDERFFFLYQPEILVDLTPYKFVNTVQAAQKTRQLIERAVQKGLYKIVDDTLFEMNINRLGNRVENRAEKMSLFFAVDLGKDEIDESCMERALAIANYELAVKKYLAAFESTTKEGALQGEIIQILQRNGGKLNLRDLERALRPLKHGTYLWDRVYKGLLNAGWICESGSGVKGDPKQVILMRIPPEEDE
jgi:hypothetical protein